ncbi:MAG: flagellar hook-length control protein FliK [Fibromonadales bacterium]|nr:flagellar hook-length control protein FliK [Fibromonadales bacterium]
MNSEVSILPGPVAAELSGAGSFFGSCQVASSNFGAFLADAETEIGEASVGVADATPEDNVGLVELFLRNIFKTDDEAEDEGGNKVLKRLKEVLGEEAGAEAFKVMQDFFNNNELLSEYFGPQMDLSKFPELAQVLKILKGEAPVEDLKALLEYCVKEMKEMMNDKPIVPKSEDLPEQAEAGFIIQPEKAQETLVVTEDLIESSLFVMAEKLDIPPEDREKFYWFMNDLLENGFITLKDLDDTIAEFGEEGTEPEFDFFWVTLKNLWDSVKNEDEPKKEELLAMLKEVADIKESTKELEETLRVNPASQEKPEQQIQQALQPQQTVQQPQQLQPFKPLSRRIQRPQQAQQAQQPQQVQQTQRPQQAQQPQQVQQVQQPQQAQQAQQEVQQDQRPQQAQQPQQPQQEQPALQGQEVQPAQPAQQTQQAKPTQPAQPELQAQQPQQAQPVQQAQPEQQAQPAQQPQPEVRAVWDGSGMKIEVFDAKTGEKLESVPTSSNMQERIHELEVIRQVVAKAKFITTPTGEQKMTLQLRPEHLGQLDLRVVLNRGEMQIFAKVESATAQHALENNINFLREGLEKQGIHLDRLEVSIEQREKQDAWSLAQERREQKGHHNRQHKHGRETRLAVSVNGDAKADTGRRLGYNTMEYLA